MVVAVGLEPTKPFRAGELQSPAIATMRYYHMEGAVGFQPTGSSSPPAVFKTVTITHSATLPNCVAGSIGFEPMDPD